LARAGREAGGEGVAELGFEQVQGEGVVKEAGESDASGDALGRDGEVGEPVDRGVDHLEVGLQAGGDAVDRGDGAELVDADGLGRLPGVAGVFPAGAERQA
jgi:hypothetical protein